MNNREVSDERSHLQDAFVSFMRCPNQFNYHQLNDLLATYRIQWFKDRIIPIELLQLNIHTYTTLKQQNIDFVGHLLDYTPEELQKLPGMTIEQIKDVNHALDKQLAICLHRLKSY